MKIRSWIFTIRDVPGTRHKHLYRSIRWFDFIFSMVLIIGPINRAFAYADEQDSQEPAPAISSSAFSVEKIKRNNNAFHFELSFSEIPVEPDIFYRDSLNGDKLKLQGVNVALGKGFALGSYLFVDFDLRGIQSTLNSTVPSTANISGGTTDLVRKSSMLSYQGIIHIGFNIRSVMIDHASMHPFIGGGVFQSTFTDTYVDAKDKSTFNKITEGGALAEAGVNFIDHYSGFYSTFRVGRFLSSSLKSNDANTDGTALAINDTGKIGTDKSTYYAFGFGVKF